MTSFITTANATEIKTKESRRQAVSPLKFKKITLADIPQINRILQDSTSRTCDCTVGGIFMWIDYFDYSYCIYRDTLFIKGVSELYPDKTAFSLPLGKMDIAHAIGMLKEYCMQNNIELRFSAIPEDRLEEFRSVGLTDTEQLVDWGDYLYDIEKLATLSGKKMSKKRNHVNRFEAENEGYRLEPLTPDRVHRLKVDYDSWLSPEDLDRPTAIEEHRQVVNVLDNLLCYPFEGLILLDGSGRAVAFTLGEVIGDTLFVHIEKMRHDVAGAGETINKSFARYMLDRHPGLRFANREEDTGDPGLRKAKESYHPEMILRKYDIIV